MQVPKKIRTCILIGEQRLFRFRVPDLATPQAQLLIVADLRGMTEVVFEHCAADLLTRAAAHAAFSTPAATILTTSAMMSVSWKFFGV